MRQLRWVRDEREKSRRDGWIDAVRLWLTLRRLIFVLYRLAAARAKRLAYALPCRGLGRGQKGMRCGIDS